MSDIFDVKVGGVSGADPLFRAGGRAKNGREFVNSKTIDTGMTRRMIFADLEPMPPKELLKHKEALLRRRIKSFDETNWWHWGRRPPEDDRERVYVNAKTRRREPFFVHDCKQFDGAVLALMIKKTGLDPKELAADLNAVDWNELGFVSGGRFMFQQRSLQNAPLPEAFRKYIG